MSKYDLDIEAVEKDVCKDCPLWIDDCPAMMKSETWLMVVNYEEVVCRHRYEYGNK